MQALSVHSSSLSFLMHNCTWKADSFSPVFFPLNGNWKKQGSVSAHASLADRDSSESLLSQPSPEALRQALPKNLFLLDVAPLCYCGKRPSPSALIGWLKPLFSDVTSTQPIIAVIDGERGNEYRKQLLPTYKSNRNVFVPLSSAKRRQTWKGDDADLREAFPLVKLFLKACSIPVVTVEDAEADDVVASLTEQAVHKGFRVTIASPDKDFKQLLCKNVQLLVPLTELQRWSFYTEKLYVEQHGCDPEIELSLRCLLGDKVDCIPGLAEFSPGFGRKTALKLLRKHGSLERLLHEASIRTVGKAFVQDALTRYAPVLWKNLEVLRLRRDLPVHLMGDWCTERDTSNDEKAFSELERHLKDLQIQRAQKDGVRSRNVVNRTVVRSSGSGNKSKQRTAVGGDFVISPG